MSRKQYKDEFFSIKEIKEAARGREVAILEKVAGIAADVLDETKREYPCPKCGGDTRFRMIDAEAGAVFCSHCFKENNGDFIAAVRWMREVDLPEALRLIGDHLGLRSDRPAPASPKTTAKETTGTWVYTDAEGKPLYRVKRIEWTENGKPRKSFSQERHVGGQWKPGLGGVDPVPLHWPELRRRSKETVYIVEGEKCCDLLTGFGLLATTASGGSNTKIDWAKYLPGRDVVLLPDEDKPGYGYALQTADQLLKSGCAIKVIFLPDLDPKDDVADWIERGGTREDLSRIVEETPDWDGKPFAYSTGDTAGKDGKGLAPVRPRLIDPSTLKPRKIDWLWENKLPAKRLSLLTGLKGQGKTFWTCYLASVITNGYPWADGKHCERGSVLFFRGEDIIEEDYIPRLVANSADLTKIRFLDGFEVLHEGKEPEEVAFSIGSTQKIEVAIAETQRETGFPVRLVIIDPVSNFWGEVKENSNAEVRSALNPLSRLAERSGAAFLLIQHTGKGDKEHAQQKVLGSTGLAAICRTLWGLYYDKATERRYFAPIDTNCCIDPAAVEFTVERPHGEVRIVNASLEKTGDDIEDERRAFRQQRGPQADKLAECCDWLRDFLQVGGKPANEVKEAGEQAGFSVRTVERAKKECGIISPKEAFSGRWVWALETPFCEGRQDTGEGEESEGLAVFGQPLQDKDLRQGNHEGRQVSPIYKQLGGLGENDLFEGLGDDLENPTEPPPETTPPAPPKGPKRYRASEAAKTLLEE